MSQICKICHWRPSTILELAGRLLLRSLEQRQIEGWSWWQNWPILCALQLCCWVEDLNSNGLGSRPASMKMYKSRRNGRKSPKNRKLHLKCGGLRWTQWSKIIFPPCLYVGMTSKFTWGLKIHILFPPLLLEPSSKCVMFWFFHYNCWKKHTLNPEINISYQFKKPPPQ